jgi:hypothetical protein
MQIEYLAPTMKEALLTLDFSGVGIVAIRPAKVEAGSDKIARAEIELYAEGLKISSGKTMAAAESAPAPAPTAAPSQEPAAAAPSAPEQTEAARPLTRAQRDRLRARTVEPAPQEPAPAK